MDPSLRSRDIQGNEPGSRNLGAFHTMKRRQIRPFMVSSDIFGSNPGSLVRGIKVPTGLPQRHSNPLAPEYQMPGSKEPEVDIKADPFNEEGCSMTQAKWKQNKARPVTGKPEKTDLPPLAPKIPDEMRKSTQVLPAKPPSEPSKPLSRAASQAGS